MHVNYSQSLHLLQCARALRLRRDCNLLLMLFTINMLVSLLLSWFIFSLSLLLRTLASGSASFTLPALGDCLGGTFKSSDLIAHQLSGLLLELIDRV
jgi:hypothetical protein